MFDVSNLSPRDQFEAAVVVSGMCLVAAIVLREWFADREVRIMARILGVAGWAVVVTFAWRMTETNETLATQLMVKSSPRADKIGEATVTTVSVTTKSGNVFQFGDMINAGRTVAMCVTARCGRRGDCGSCKRVGRCGCGDQCLCGSGRGIDAAANSPAGLHRRKQPEPEYQAAYGNGESF